MGCELRVCRANRLVLASRLRHLATVALPDQSQPGQCQEVVDLVDLLAKRGDRAGEAAGRDRGRLVAEMLTQAADDAVDLTGEAVDDPRLDRRRRGAADQLLRRLYVDLREARCAPGERLHRDLDAGRENGAEELAIG